MHCGPVVWMLSQFVEAYFVCEAAAVAVVVTRPLRRRGMWRDAVAARRMETIYNFGWRLNFLCLHSGRGLRREGRGRDGKVGFAANLGPWHLSRQSRGGEINYFARLFLEIVQSVVQRSQWREERAAADCHEVHKVPVYVSSTVVMNLYVYDVVRKWNFIVYRRCR